MYYQQKSGLTIRPWGIRRPTFTNKLSPHRCERLTIHSRKCWKCRIFKDKNIANAILYVFLLPVYIIYILFCLSFFHSATKKPAANEKWIQICCLFICRISHLQMYELIFTNKNKIRKYFYLFFIGYYTGQKLCNANPKD